MKRLLLVDGSNVLMRAAFGGEVDPQKAAPVAAGLIRRAAQQVEASHLIVTTDSPQPSWRKVLYPDYKAQRSVDTTTWLLAGFQVFTRLGWYVEECGGFEADDIIATIARRALPHGEVVVLSGDSDLLPLVDEGVKILRPVNGGRFEPMSGADVCAKYGVQSPALLRDFKAMTGEKGDNIPGVPGIGPVRASALLKVYPNLEQVVAAGSEKKCRHSALVYEHREKAAQAFKLLSLSYDAPIPRIMPSGCVFRNQ